MIKRILKLAVITTSFAAVLCFNFAAAANSTLIAREEERGVQGRMEPSAGAGHHPEGQQQYHPAAREQMHQDVNRNADANALRNAAGSEGGTYQAVPIYPTNPGTTVNVNPSPQ